MLCPCQGGTAAAELTCCSRRHARAYRPRVFTGQEQRPPGWTAVDLSFESNRRIPWCRCFTIPGCRLLNVGNGRERIMEALDHHLLRRQHVVDFPARSLRHGGILVKERMPAR